jgi:hypothetical protein
LPTACRRALTTCEEAMREIAELHIAEVRIPVLLYQV